MRSGKWQTSGAALVLRRWALFSFFCDVISVADPGCLSRIPDPDFYPSRISDPGSKNSSKREGWKKICGQTIFVATNFAKLNIILFWIRWRKKFGPIFQESFNFLPKKLSPSPQKYGFGIRDPRSGIRDREKTYSGSRIQGSKRHRSRIPDPGSWSATLNVILYSKY